MRQVWVANAAVDDKSHARRTEPVETLAVRFRLEDPRVRGERKDERGEHKPYVL